MTTTQPAAFVYDAITFSDGNVFASGGVFDESRESSYSYIWAPAQAGYAIGQLNVSLDEYGASNAGFWVLGADRVAGLVQITYFDVDYPGGASITYIMPAEDCATYPF